jgi:phosphotransferase system enzyme I (PtsI)
VIRLVDMTVQAAKRAGIPCSVCGESASDPVLASLWASLGCVGLSMSASYIPVIRKTLRSIAPEDAAALADEVRALCATAGAEEIYGHARKFLRERIPDLDELQSFFAPAGVDRC